MNKFFKYVILGSIFIFLYYYMQYFILSFIDNLYEIGIAQKITISMVLILLFLFTGIYSHHLNTKMAKKYYIYFSIYLASIWILFFLSVIMKIIKNFVPYDYLYQISLPAIYVLIIKKGLKKSHNFNIKNIDIISKKIKKDIKTVLITDIHLGPINTKKYLNKILSKIEELKPDMLLISGDLIDDIGFIDDKVLSPFRSFKKDIYASFGNHEKYLGYEKCLNYYKKSNVKLLYNKKTDLKDNISITGIENVSSFEKKKIKKLLEDINPKKENFNIFLSHEPLKTSIIKDHNIDLQLSGHTHAGQIFPFNILVKIFYPMIHGLYYKDNINTYVSSGVATWGPPIRFGSTNEIVLINLKKEI